MKIFITAFCLMVAAILPEQAAAVSSSGPPDVEACIKPEQMDVHQIEDCLDRLVLSSNAELNREYAAATAGLDARSQRLLETSQDAFNAWWKLEVEAAHGPWREKYPATRQIEAMVNAITICRERRDELHRLYVDK
ncbi:DUF1311 domain-containing protein [Rhizobium leguminosarum]|uniref:lysozyme inhibitor LprI family protein n=1 Tax=Rhizobium leguminosarum TaxID=384 RepID=UPI00102FCCEE|nr:lysozyme inhibitor LprI family protein [Rhizobium leguminosarum]TAU90821.1 DUF1311 domain-containing protein [Rhizobium leguminosarum]TAV55480.1 DUF1311 domain-containing protein [Rhizobium leguminosarum]TAX57721.1 DUF1311 domain-containing protein [Rhizobium leguminosarum]TAX62062.1 DUF1311 domain-containing protein [Rhizobium leguminosarum]TAY03591.1 DUF1311 domain-containing protein [Rhizobium leguminosarum]